ncbi:endo alpha-1,4 polygalactosaminidase [Cumulibacter soli]|uniref:endo alpha-1,4 polygalactosaminidase n=1 Tax=Cumulibacter soli TaxID=2546344 RepID=UPI001ABB62C7|nr:endo alpha-1,4 polygalactosaminidase [Cumulibacter soli]
MQRSIILAVVTVAMAALVGCAPAPDDSSDPLPRAQQRVRLPPTHGVFDYQLGGAYDLVQTSSGEQAPDVVTRDANAAAPVDGYGICYVNGFQTQPDESAEWASTRESLLVHDADGGLVSDPDWPDEYILDPSTGQQRDGILAVVGPLIDSCATSGFSAVEIDNLDTWTRFEQIDPDGAWALAAAYVDRAHAAGLAIAQKNSPEVAALAHDELGFDFATTEECAVFGECGLYAAAYGPHVLQIEYPDALKDAGIDFSDVCALTDRSPLTILRDGDLVPRGTDGYVYDRCE